MRSKLWLGLAAFVLAAVVTSAAYYRGVYRAPGIEPFAYEAIEIRGLAPGGFTDTPKKTEGRAIIDLSYDNNFTPPEANLLTLRLATRGLSIEYFEKEKRDPDNKEIKLKDKLKDASAMVIIAPKKTYVDEDLTAIKDFVKNGGRLLLIGDPSRESQINRVAVLYGLVFDSGYLFNLKENENNYRDVFFTDFKSNKITADLKRIVLFTAGSVSSNDRGIVFGDENTRTTLETPASRLSPLALAEGDKVLALHDLTFLSEPYSSLADNNRLISNIADWLAEGRALTPPGDGDEKAKNNTAS
ncbi:MAG: hypothetical protein HW414_1006 [Dehalococcoidia bacterium]|nr:hypothetical protein [Dehalococcoidia bacterium]